MISRARLVLCDSEPTRPVGLASSGWLDELLGEFPSVELTLTRDGHHERAAGDVVVDARDWRSPACNPREFDAMVAPRLEHGARTLDVRGRADAARDALEILTRYQRFVGRRNASSRGGAFERALELFRAMHDTTKPLVVADLDHAFDTWQWTLRLDPRASTATQLAALFHDVERLRSESDARIEHRAPDYRAFKEAHARGGAQMTHNVLRDAGVDVEAREEAAWLVGHHETPSPSSDPGDDGRTVALTTLNDADALSFFSLNSPGFVDYFGLDHAHRKVSYTLARMSRPARARLGRIRLRADVARILAEALT